MNNFRFYKAPAPVNRLLIESDGTRLVALLLEKEIQELEKDGRLETVTDCGDDAVIRQTEKWLDEYFSGKNPEIADLPLAPSGTEFRRQVWELLCRIPYGEVVTYGELACEMARLCGKEKMSARAVGSAVGKNPIAIIIPCHRVVGSDGSLTGYGGGLDVKIKLLQMEGLDMNRFYRPARGTKL